MKDAATPETWKILRTVFLAAILIATVAGVVSSQLVETPPIEGSTATFVFVALLFVSVLEMALAKYVTSKSIENATGSLSPRDQAAAVGFGMAAAIALYGLVMGSISGKWFYVVPFGVIAIVAWQMVGAFVQTLPDARETADPFSMRSDI
ncbi:MAG TPA: hypothetical protein VFX19_09095 [Dehalococcoidia bacterium]|nr:hypothetical protein [Dehalococcoidia bacterium]